MENSELYRSIDGDVSSIVIPEQCRFTWGEEPITSSNIQCAIDTCEFWDVDELPILLFEAGCKLQLMDLCSNKTVKKLLLVKKCITYKYDELLAHSENIDCMNYISGLGKYETVIIHSFIAANKNAYVNDAVLCTVEKEHLIAAKCGATLYLTELVRLQNLRMELYPTSMTLIYNVRKFLMCMAFNYKQYLSSKIVRRCDIDDINFYNVYNHKFSSAEIDRHSYLFIITDIESLNAATLLLYDKSVELLTMTDIASSASSNLISHSNRGGWWATHPPSNYCDIIFKVIINPLHKSIKAGNILLIMYLLDKLTELNIDQFDLITWKIIWNSSVQILELFYVLHPTGLKESIEYCSESDVETRK
jgi:hypothetical protein